MAQEDKVKTTNSSSIASNDQPCETKVEAQKRLVEELKVQWKQMWSERFDDKVLAEGVSISNYVALDVEQGTVIHATRTFKALSFKEIVEKHVIENPERFFQPDVHIGGWKKFIKTEINGAKGRKNNYSASYVKDKPTKKSPKQQSKKGGRGWLHSK